LTAQAGFAIAAWCLNRCSCSTSTESIAYALISLNCPVASGDRDVYLVFDDFGPLGHAWRETGEERRLEDRRHRFTPRAYSDPVRIVAFNTAEGWSRDVSEEIADEIPERSGMNGFDVPPFLERFVEWHPKRPAKTTAVAVTGSRLTKEAAN
jgi:hypothetical protein